MENEPQTRDERARCQALDRAVGNAARSGSSGDTDQIVADARLFHEFLMGTPGKGCVVTSSVTVPGALTSGGHGA
jgi:hypothetical protein